MEFATSTGISIKNTIWLAILSSTLLATVIGFILGWVKEFFQRKNDKEQKAYEKLYGELIYHLIAMKVLKVNRQELLDEILKEPVGSTAQESVSKFSDVNPLIEKWNEHKEMLRQILEAHAGYINKKHLRLVEDFLDGVVKRDITQNGASRHTTEIRTSKMLDAVEALQNALLPRGE